MNFSQLVDSKKSTKRSSLNSLDLLGYVEENSFDSEEIAKEKVFKIEKIGKRVKKSQIFSNDKLKGINEQNSPNKTCSTNYLSESNNSPFISGNPFDFNSNQGTLPNTVYSNSLNNIDPLKKNVINIYTINICGNEADLKKQINGNEQANQVLQVLGVNNNKNTANINKSAPSQPIQPMTTPIINNNNINNNLNNKSNLNINQNNIIQSLIYLYNQRLINSNSNPNLNSLINNPNINNNQTNCVKNSSMNNNTNTNNISNCNMNVDSLFNINSNTNNYRTTADATFKDERNDDYTSFFNDSPFNQIDDFDYINNKINDA